MKKTFYHLLKPFAIYETIKKFLENHQVKLHNLSDNFTEKEGVFSKTGNKKEDWKAAFRSLSSTFSVYEATFLTSLEKETYTKKCGCKCESYFN